MDFEAMDAEDTPVIEITMMLSICPFIFWNENNILPNCFEQSEKMITEG